MSSYRRSQLKVVLVAVLNQSQADTLTINILPYKLIYFSNKVSADSDDKFDIMLTAQDDDIDQIIGLKLGAENYFNKRVQAHVSLTKTNPLLNHQIKLSNL